MLTGRLAPDGDYPATPPDRRAALRYPSQLSSAPSVVHVGDDFVAVAGDPRRRTLDRATSSSLVAACASEVIIRLA